MSSQLDVSTRVLTPHLWRCGPIRCERGRRELPARVRGTRGRFWGRVERPARSAQVSLGIGRDAAPWVTVVRALAAAAARFGAGESMYAGVRRLLTQAIRRLRLRLHLGALVTKGLPRVESTSINWIPDGRSAWTVRSPRAMSARCSSARRCGGSRSCLGVRSQ
jgi:hypothetical protein